MLYEVSSDNLTVVMQLDPSVTFSKWVRVPTSDAYFKAQLEQSLNCGVRINRDLDMAPYVIEMHCSLRYMAPYSYTFCKRGSVWTFIRQILYQCKFVYLALITDTENKNFENVFSSFSKFLFSQSVNQTKI